MNYSKFCCYEAPLSSLTQREIENPYLVLDELYTKRSLEDFHTDFSNFKDTIHKKDEWKKYDPLHLYNTCKDLTRLIDILWLINKYSPGLSSVTKPGSSSLENCRMMNDFNLLFLKHVHRRNTSPVQQEADQDTVLNAIYEDRHLGFTKIDFYNYLQIGLDASYMRNDKYEYFGIEEHHFFIKFAALSTLIEEGFKIYQKGKSAFPNLLSCPEIVFAIDTDRPIYLSHECIANPSDYNDHFYGYYLNADHIHEGLRIWESLLYESNFWARAGNPGNLLYLHECLLTLIEGTWLLDQRGKLKKASQKYQPKKEYKTFAKNLSKEEFKDPLLVFHRFFRFKKMHEWRTLLNAWLKCSLSNSEALDTDTENETGPGFKYLLKLLEAIYLLTYTLEED